jgi:hypothetical protein
MNSQRLVAIGLVILMALALVGCNVLGGVIPDGVEGSGVIATQEYDFSDFNEVELSHAFQGTISRGDSFSVVVRIDDNLVDRLRVEQTGNRIFIGLEQTVLTGQATLEADVTLPALTRVHTSGASSAQLNGFASTDDFRAEASGASRIHGDLSAGDVAFNASGASTIALAGEGGNVTADASGASTIDLEEFAVVDAEVIASGASTVTVNASGQLDADASGASNVYYLGSPTMGDINTNGGSNVEQR